MAELVHGQSVGPYVSRLSIGKTGVWSAVVTIPLQIAPEGENIFSVLQNLPQPPRLPGMLPQSYGMVRKAGGYAVQIGYEGGGPSGGGYDAHPEWARDGERPVDYSFDGSFEQAPIEANKNFDRLAARYNWDEEKREFSRTWEGGGEPTGGVVDGPGAGEEQLNPLYGTDSFFRMGAVVSKRYTVETVPASLWTGIGGISSPDVPAELLPDIPDRNFLKMPPVVQLRGNVPEITERWMMSGPGGFNVDVYDLSAESES